MDKLKRFSPDVRERAVRLVSGQEAEHSSQWAAIGSIAATVGCEAETLRLRVRQAERDRGRRAGPTTSEAERIEARAREDQELHQTHEIPRIASALFAQTEFDRRFKP